MSPAAEAPPRARLLCRTGELAGQTHELTHSNVIGRNSDNDVVLHSSLISGRHARIWEKDGSFFVEDLGSSNGTWVDGIRITDPVRLDRLNVITFAGVFDFVFAVAEPGARREARPEAEAGGAATVRLTSEEGHAATAAGAASGTEASAETGPPSTPSPPDDAQRTRLDMDFQPLPELENDEAEPAARETGPAAGAGASSPPAEDAQHTRLDMDFQPLPDLEETEAETPTEKRPAAETPTEKRPAARRPAAETLKPETSEPDDAGRTRMDMTGFGALPDLEEGKAMGCRLEVSLPDSRQQVFDLDPGTYTMGRSPDCDVTVEEPSISRHHATLTVGETLVLEDADSVNGTLVDGSEIDRVEIAPNTTFSLGPFVEVKVTKP
jgi:pSer/pThr/pTyr-binding forkhead associated (FHA) protein